MNKGRVYFCFFLVLFALFGGMTGCGYREKSSDIAVTKTESLPPSDLVNTCVMVVSGEEVKGTVLFAVCRGENTSLGYFVTARHVVEKLTNSFLVWPRLVLKLKRQEDQNAAFACVPVEKMAENVYWYQSTYGNADLAVFPIPNYAQLINDGFDIRLYETLILAASPQLFKNTSKNEFFLTARKGSIAAALRTVMRYTVMGHPGSSSLTAQFFLGTAEPQSLCGFQTQWKTVIVATLGGRCLSYWALSPRWRGIVRSSFQTSKGCFWRIRFCRPSPLPMRWRRFSIM